MILKKFLTHVFNNCARPQGWWGRVMLRSMNFGHRPAHRWGRAHLQLRGDECVLDVGCGGGSNLAAFLKVSPAIRVVGVDVSDESVACCLRVNAGAVAEGRCTVLRNEVSRLAFADGAFDVVTAFETVYFWPDIVASMREVRRVLKPGGVFLICNETDGTQPSASRWAGIIDGMTNYTQESLSAILREAGFSDLRCDVSQNHFLCITARA